MYITQNEYTISRGSGAYTIITDGGVSTYTPELGVSRKRLKDTLKGTVPGTTFEARLHVRTSLIFNHPSSPINP